MFETSVEQELKARTNLEKETKNRVYEPAKFGKSYFLDISLTRKFKSML